MTTQPQPEARDCEHGQLARSCDRCADAREIAELRAECESLHADRDSWERQCSDRVDDAVEFIRQRDEARAERDALRDAIVAFADGQSWADDRWKAQAHVAPLFDIAARAAKEQSK